MTCALAILALGAVTASSASAFSWWVGSPPMELAAGTKLPINPAAVVHKPFTLKWLHSYEVKCTALSYDEMYLEGPVFLGAKHIVFEKCAAKKPKHTTLLGGGTIETAQLGGEIKPNSPNVDFEFTPVGGTLTTFTLERTIKRKHKRPSRLCKLEVSASGGLGGTLGNAEPISNEKAFEFDSKNLTLKQHRSCTTAAGVKPAGSPREEAERIKRELAECKKVPPAKSKEECAKVLKEAKGLGKKEKEAGEEEAEEAKEASEAQEEEAGGAVEENKGESSYSATEGWGVL